MESKSLNNSILIQTAALLVILSIAIAIMIIAKSFLIPLAWSLIIALSSYQLLNRIERRYHMSRFVSSLVFVSLLLLVIILIFYFFLIEVTSIINGVPSFSEKLINVFQNAITALQGYGVPLPMIEMGQINSWISSHSAVITKALTAISKSIGNIGLVGIYLFFILFYRDNYLHYMQLREKTVERYARAKQRSREIIMIINNFLTGLFITTIIMAVLLYFIFLLIGIKYALFFAVLVSLLSLIPYIGNVIGMIIVIIFAAISTDGFLVPALALAGLILTNTLKSNVFKPIIIGAKINLNAFVIFLSVITGGLIWGISGMILFMPFVGIVKVLLENNESTKPLAALFMILPKHELQPAKKEVINEDTA